MKEVYHYTGFIVFWAIVAVVAIVVGTYLAGGAYGLLKGLYHRTRLFFWLDYKKWLKEDFLPMTDDPDLAAGYCVLLKKHISGKWRHPYREEIFCRLISKIYRCPNIKMEFDRHEDYKEVLEKAVRLHNAPSK